MLTYKVRLKIYEGDKEVLNTISAKKLRIIDFVKVNEFKKPLVYNLRVSYSDKGPDNEGTYTTKKDFYHALSAFTEPGLLKDSFI